MSQPNILLLFPDQWRSDWVGLDTPSVPTPFLDSLAHRGVRFTQCVTPSPLCAPARASLALGCGYRECGVASNGQNLALDRPNFYQCLRDRGYSVGGVGKFDLGKALHDHGGDGKRLLPEWGFTHGCDSEGKWDGVGQMKATPLTGPYGRFLESRGLIETYVADMEKRRGADSYRNTAPSPIPHDAYCDNWVTQNALDCLGAFPKGSPWFLQVNFPGPHEPMDAPSWVLETLRSNTFPAAVCHTMYSQETVQEIRRAYTAMVTNLDQLCAQIVHAVESRGDAGNTWIIFSSDHGEMLGDHDRFAKNTWHEASIRVPLIVAGPGAARGAHSDALVQLEDLAATCLDLAGAEGLPSEARSIAPLLRSPGAAHRQVLRSGLKDWTAAMDVEWKLVRYDDGRELLVDRTRPDGDAFDVARGNPAVVDRLRAQLC